jgi:hypothetical protein
MNRLILVVLFSACGAEQIPYRGATSVGGGGGTGGVVDESTGAGSTGGVGGSSAGGDESSGGVESTSATSSPTSTSSTSTTTSTSTTAVAGSTGGSTGDRPPPWDGIVCSGICNVPAMCDDLPEKQEAADCAAACGPAWQDDCLADACVIACGIPYDIALAECYTAGDCASDCDVRVCYAMCGDAAVDCLLDAEILGCAPEANDSCIQQRSTCIQECQDSMPTPAIQAQMYARAKGWHWLFLLIPPLWVLAWWRLRGK